MESPYIPMTSICVIPICPGGHDKAERITKVRQDDLRKLAEYGKRHHLTADPHLADVILFNLAYPLHLSLLDPWRQALRTNKLVGRYRSKSLVLDNDDLGLPFAPGLYTGIDSGWYDQRFHRTAPYTHYLGNKALEPQRDGSASFLFSFVGDARTHPCRARILSLNHMRALIRDTSSINPWQDADVKNKWRQQFAESIHSSDFVLCPRGRGTSSVRVFEVMCAGKVPVIVSDAWVPPSGPAWDELSIRISENDIGIIPSLLEEREHDAPSMGKAARLAWERWFSKESVFDNMVDWCMEIQSHGELEKGWKHFSVLPHILTSRDQIRRCILRPLKSRAEAAVCSYRR
jgi:hypothetical protein